MNFLSIFRLILLVQSKLRFIFLVRSAFVQTIVVPTKLRVVKQKTYKKRIKLQEIVKIEYQNEIKMKNGTLCDDDDKTKNKWKHRIFNKPKHLNRTRDWAFSFFLSHSPFLFVVIFLCDFISIREQVYPSEIEVQEPVCL